MEQISPMPAIVPDSSVQASGWGFWPLCSCSGSSPTAWAWFSRWTPWTDLTIPKAPASLCPWQINAAVLPKPLQSIFMISGVLLYEKLHSNSGPHSLKLFRISFEFANNCLTCGMKLPSTPQQSFNFVVQHITHIAYYSCNCTVCSIWFLPRKIPLCPTPSQVPRCHVVISVDVLFV